jgi:hypothetical protein
MGSKCLALDACHNAHVQEIILPRNMFVYPLKLNLGFFRIFCDFCIKPKYSHKIMYECECGIEQGVECFHQSI